MILNLQFFGGSGSSLGGGGSLGGGSGSNINVESETDIWNNEIREGNKAAFDEIIKGVNKINNDFPGLMTESLNVINQSRLGGKDKNSTLGFYSPGNKSLGMNENFMDVNKMNKVYDASGSFHPSRGNKSAVEAVTLHELGHAVNDHLASKKGQTLDKAASEIVKRAYKKSGAKGGNKGFAKTISGYAASNYAECVAEAVADYYCNGKKAKKASKLIVDEMKNY